MTNHTNHTTIQLDFAFDGSFDEALAELAAMVPGLTSTVVEAAGPGGWPVIEVTLPVTSLPALAEAYGADYDELEAWAC